MKKSLFVVLVSTSATLTAVVVLRLSADALAIIAGILLGILAMSPTLLVIMWLLRARAQPRGQSAPPVYPPIIVAGGAPLSLPQQMPTESASPEPPPNAASRQWVMRVYGEE